MQNELLISVLTFASNSNIDDQFDEWWENEHLPYFLKSENVLSANHYRIIQGLSDPSHPGLAEPEGGYGRQLIIFEHKNKESLELFNSSIEKRDFLLNIKNTWKRGQININFDGQYRLRGEWKGKGEGPTGVLHITGTLVPPEAEDALNSFYYNKTIPVMTKNSMLIRVKSYEMVGGIISMEPPYSIQQNFEYPRYYNIYEFKTTNNFKNYEHSPEMKINNENFANFSQSWPNGTFRVGIRAQYFLIDTIDTKDK